MVTFHTNEVMYALEENIKIAPESFLSLFLRRVAISPAAPAIVVEGMTVRTYSELLNGARGVATRLTEIGTKRGNLVALRMERSPEFVEALLGVWMAGCAFLPLDSSAPVSRIEFILNEARPCAVMLSGGIEIPLADPQRLPSFGDLAYMIYTSGSTGKPKGVEVLHSGIVNLLNEQISAFELDSSSRNLWMLSPGFDASLSDIGTTLLAGAALCIEPQETLMPGKAFLRLLGERGISHIDMPPSFLQHLAPIDAPACLKTIVIGGEACAAQVVRAWAARVNLVNVYGPTEATVCTSLVRCGTDWERSLIGRPLAHTFYSIRDENRNPVPCYDAGELYISGIGLARGYFQRETMNSERFVEIDGVRWYRSGDLVRQVSDGNFEFLGRVDRQIKRRGKLIAPEEIESALCEHPAVAEAALVARDNAVRLCAYIALKDNEVADLEKLRADLAERLPNWMLPSSIKILPSLPRNRHNKIDFAALESLLTAIEQRTDGTTDGDAEELQLLDLCRTAFKLPQLGIEDDFIESGADSLSILCLMAAAAERGLRLSAQQIYSAQNVRTLCKISRAPAVVGYRATELSRDAELDASLRHMIARRKTNYASDPRTILLSGATGFFGSHLLAELLLTTDASIVCLARAKDNESAHARVIAALSRLHIDLNPARLARITAFCGDVGQSNFGLSDPDWSRLANSVDSVYHSAATVSIVESYERLKRSNLDGSREMLRFCCEGRAKRLHYVSTLSVFVASDCENSVLRESDTLPEDGMLYGGYAASKWAAEKLLTNARDAGFSDLYIYRLGLLTANSRTGEAPCNDQFAYFLRMLALLRTSPKMEGEMPAIDVTPVDFAAKALCRISVRASNVLARVFHIANEQALTLGKLKSVFDELGLSLVDVAPDKFAKAVEAATAADYHGGTLAAWAGTQARFGARTDSGEFKAQDLFLATRRSFDTSNSRAILADMKLECPAADKELIGIYLKTIVSAFVQEKRSDVCATT